MLWVFRELVLAYLRTLYSTLLLLSQVYIVLIEVTHLKVFLFFPKFTFFRQHTTGTCRHPTESDLSLGFCSKLWAVRVCSYWGRHLASWCAKRTLSLVWVIYIIIKTMFDVSIRRDSCVKWRQTLRLYGVCPHVWQFSVISSMNYGELKHRTEKLFSLS